MMSVPGLMSPVPVLEPPPGLPVSPEGRLPISGREPENGGFERPESLPALLFPDALLFPKVLFPGRVKTDFPPLKVIPFEGSLLNVPEFCRPPLVRADIWPD